MGEEVVKLNVVAKISFAGSLETESKLYEIASKGMKKVIME